MNKIAVNVDVLAALAPSEQDEFSSILAEQLGSNTELASALREIQTQERAERTKAAAREIQKLVQAASQNIVATVEDLRACKAREAALRTRLKMINRARDYGYETMNFLPLVGVLTNTPTGHKVPDDWVPKNPTPKETVPRKTTKASK